MIAAAETATPSKVDKKRLVRRLTADNSQRMRHAVQWFFVVLNAALGIQFYLWVRYFEHGGTGPHVSRPAGVEGWLPIAGLMNTKYLAETGHVPMIHPAAMFLFLAFVGMSLLLKKAFCSWICPVGTLSEYLWKLGRKIFGRNSVFPKWLDVPLRGLKYLLLGFFVYLIGAMSADAILGFMSTPYGLMADVKMLNFFRYVGETAAVILIALVLLSVLVQNFWCRYLCPYGALMGLTSLLSPVKIRRDKDACIDCGKCARACPASLKVDELVQIRSVECTACMECVAVCPAENALQLALAPRKAETTAQRWSGRRLAPVLVSAVLMGIFLGFVSFAKMTGHWKTNLPETMYMELVPNVNEAAHPGM